MRLAKLGDARAWLALVLVLYVAVAVTFSLNMPLLEGSDEPAHYEYILSLVRSQGLPVQQVGRGKHNYEAHQAPLYYLACAMVTAWVDSTDYAHLVAVNPYTDYDPLSFSNKNLYLHGRHETFPFTGAVLAMHLARLVGVAAGAGAIAATFALARTLLPERKELWIGAAAFVAFVPQFGSTSATVNNDSLALLTVALVLVQVARMASGAAAPALRQFAALGALFSLALLSKETGLLLAPFTALVVCGVAVWRGWKLRQVTAGGAIVVLVTIALTAWWYAIRQAALGFLLGSPDTRVALTELFHWDRLVDHWTESEISFWGLFGWNIVPLPQIVYDGLHWLALIGLAGLAVWLLGWRRRSAAERLASVMLIGWVVLMGAAYAAWVSASAQPHGRLFFPALPALAILLCMGWTQWAPRRWQSHVLLVVAAALFGLSAMSATALMDEAYPSPLPASANQAEKQLQINFGDRAAALGYTALVDMQPDGDILTLSVIWQTTAQIDTDYTVSVQVFDESGQRIGHLDTYPVSGMHLTSDWRVGETFMDTYRLRLDGRAHASQTARLTLGIYDRVSGKALQIVHPDGRRTARTDIGAITVR